MLHARQEYNDLTELDRKIPKKEPVFLLRAQDMVAADVVRYWAQKHAELGGSATLVASALIHAHKMDRWTKKKLAD
jgi:hypothetical protein